MESENVAGWRKTLLGCRRPSFSITLLHITLLKYQLDSMTLQVNAGPLAYAQAFLDKSVLTTHPHKHIEKLQQVYR